MTLVPIFPKTRTLSSKRYAYPGSAAPTRFSIGPPRALLQPEVIDDRLDALDLARYFARPVNLVP